MRIMEPLADNIHISADGRAIEILDQSRLPGERVYRRIRTLPEMEDALLRLRVRGAPAIGIFGAYCTYLLAEQLAVEVEAIPEDEKEASWKVGGPGEVLLFRLEQQTRRLLQTRPTAVNLEWAVRRVLDAGKYYLDTLLGRHIERKDVTQLLEVARNKEHVIEKLLARIGDEAVAIQREDIETCTRIATYGLSLLEPGDAILTHCNAGPLATSRYGTALGPAILGKEQGIDIAVYADETRPLMQGARLTVYELQQAGVDVTLITDGMGAAVMAKGLVKAVMVGCDRIAANGDTANKVGTAMLAAAAKQQGVPFYVLGPAASVDFTCASGADIPIEERSPEEVLSYGSAAGGSAAGGAQSAPKLGLQPAPKLGLQPEDTEYALRSGDPQSAPTETAAPSASPSVMYPPGTKAFNPAFDVTDHSLITAIVTEQGILRPPFYESLMQLR